MNDEKSILKFHRRNAEENGYYLTPDEELLDSLIEGLATNENRYGYGTCPCRMACAIKTYDADIICPCEYRDADVNEFGMCYCCLYISKEVKDDPSKMGSIPERRQIEVQDAAMDAKDRKERGETVEPTLKIVVASTSGMGTETPVWRCKVCGYLAARDAPPPICPICKAKADRFERFNF